jgi:anti-sigma factor RsiW
MPEHVNEWLSAYSDGELRGARLRQVENHLGECAECQAELDALRDLSHLLHESPPTGDFTSTERFVSQLNLKLPRQPEKPLSRKALEIGWWLVPFGVLGVWAFLQVTFMLSALAVNVSGAGLLDGAFAWLQVNPPQAEWLNALVNFFGAQPGMTTHGLLVTLNNANLYLEGLMGQVIGQALLAVAYLAWLASWWFRQPAQYSNPAGMETSAQ